MSSTSLPGFSLKRWLFVLIGASLLICSHARAQSLSDLVRIEARLQTEQERKELRGTMEDEVTQRKTLHITITGKAKSPETRSGTWVVFGRDLKGNDFEVLEKGNFKIDLGTGSQTIESKKVSTTFTPEHSVGGGGGGGGNKKNRKAKPKRIEAEGEKFAGYVVTVKDGGKIVGQISDPPGLETRVK